MNATDSKIPLPTLEALLEHLKAEATERRKGKGIAFLCLEGNPRFVEHGGKRIEQREGETDEAFEDRVRTAIPASSYFWIEDGMSA